MIITSDSANCKINNKPACTKLALISGFIVTLLFVQNVNADSQRAKSKLHLDLKQYVNQVVGQNIQIKTRKLDLDTSKLSIEVQKAEFDPVFDISVNRNGNRRLNTIQQQLTSSSLSEFYEKNNVYDVAISKKTKTGADIQFGVNLESLNNNVQPDFIRNREVVSFAGLSVTQPLLKNRGIGTTAPLEVAKIGNKLAHQSYRNTRLNVVFDAINSYWDLYEANYVAVFRKETVNTVSRLLNVIKKRSNLGNAPVTDVLVLQSRLANAYSELNLAKAFQTNRHNVSKYFLGISSYENSDKLDLKNIKLKKLTASVLANHKRFKLNKDEAMLSFLKNNPDYLASKVRAKQEDLRLIYAHNQALPKLDLIASYGVNGLGTGVSDSIDDAFNGHTRAQWSIGLNLSVPFYNRKGKSDVKIAMLKKRQALNNIKETEIKLGNELLAMIGSLDYRYENIKALKRAWDVDKRIFYTVRDKYRKDLSSLDNVIESEQQLTLSKEQLLLGVIGYQRSFFKVKQLEGSLFAYFDVKK